MGEKPVSGAYVPCAWRTVKPAWRIFRSYPLKSGRQRLCARRRRRTTRTHDGTRFSERRERTGTRRDTSATRPAYDGDNNGTFLSTSPVTTPLRVRRQHRVLVHSPHSSEPAPISDRSRRRYAVILFTRISFPTTTLADAAVSLSPVLIAATAAVNHIVSQNGTARHTHTQVGYEKLRAQKLKRNKSRFGINTRV